jgi:hypothetical protein
MTNCKLNLSIKCVGAFCVGFSRPQWYCNTPSCINYESADPITVHCTVVICIAPCNLSQRGEINDAARPRNKMSTQSNHRRTVFLFARFMNSATAIATCHIALCSNALAPAARREMTRDEIAAGCNWGAHPTPTCLQYSFVAPAVVCMIGARCSL